MTFREKKVSEYAKRQLENGHQSSLIIPCKIRLWRRGKAADMEKSHHPMNLWSHSRSWLQSQRCDMAHVVCSLQVKIEEMRGSLLVGERGTA